LQKETSYHMSCLGIFKDIQNQFKRELGELQFLI
jgi:hypothetical protein